MSENEAPPQEDTPDTPDTPEADTQAEVDWRKRYEDLQPEYTRKSQRLSEIESDREAWLSVGQEKWPDLFEEDDDDADEADYDDDTDEDDEPQFMSKAEFEEFKEQQARERAAERFSSDLKELVGDRELSEYGQDVIFARAQRGEIKNKDDLRGLVEALLERETPPENKTTRKKPAHVPPGGKPASGQPDFSGMSRDEVNDWMVSEVRARTAQT